MGANAFKFGVYFGRTKYDSKRKYRFATRYGRNLSEAFSTVRSNIVRLVEEGAKKNPDFELIDSLLVSPLFKGKILSLYFPEKFINICSPDHIRNFNRQLGGTKDSGPSQGQHRLIEVKNRVLITRKMSNPRFMMFLYRTYREGFDGGPSIGEPRGKHHKQVDFEELKEMWGKIGRRAEKFARAWEEDRLRGRGLEHLVKQIKDCRSMPSYGYDFLSFTDANQRRCIEVKSVSRRSGDYRFFLSANERTESEQNDEYYFYLVKFDGRGKPVELEPVPSAYLRTEARFDPTVFAVYLTLPE